ncbi:phosphatase 2A regulatory subunit [Cryptosporidium sp. chipmunk genotype I]|uniref:phosphatase 2A regulatory subunit n=1 Tax=Cryptosporidium sp. chipmunk genotype I TaxID=1280935 RepID=UPI00351A8766|nr:phosphatase 2A regulatory subunit [Cryptosporidium sp. chipmunk genotype I]
MTLLEKDIQCLFFEFLSSKISISVNDENAKFGNYSINLINNTKKKPSFVLKQPENEDIVDKLREIFRGKENDCINYDEWELQIVEGLFGMNKLCSGTLYKIMNDEKNWKYLAPEAYLNDKFSIQIEYNKVEDLVCKKLNMVQSDGVLNYFKLLSKLSRSKDYISPFGFKPLLDEIVNRHKALKFLVEDEIFKELYIETIISRIYYELDILELRKLRFKDFKNTDLVDILINMKGNESFDDLINYFNYQHFYVLYSRFVELDSDEDHYLTLEEFKKHDFGSLTVNALTRIWECNINQKKELFEDELNRNRKMSYHDFIYFYISDEDKTTERSIRYWFEIIDFDCDGWISSNEIEHFFREQKNRCNVLNYFVPELNNISCMMNDLLMPGIHGRYRLDDFLRNKLVAGHFFNVLVNTKKCLTSMFMDAELNSIQAMIFPKLGCKSLSPWELHCQYQYQIIQDSRNDENTEGKEKHNKY